MRDFKQYSINDMRRYIGADNFGVILDNSNAKYNEAIWKRYATWGTPSDDKEWIQGQKETPIMVRASILDTHSNKPQRNTGGWEYYGGSILKLGHGFSIDEDDLFQMRRNHNMTHVPMAILMADDVQTRSDMMIGGVHNELNYLTLQALSTGSIKEFSVDGIKHDYKFPIADSHFVKASKEWFKVVSGKVQADDTADPVQDLLDAQKYLIDSLRLNVDHWKISKELFDRLMLHPVVIKYCTGKMNYFKPENVKLSNNEILTALHDMGVWMFDVVDYKSAHEEDGFSVPDSPAFDEHNLVACSTNIVPFEMKCTNSIYLDRLAYGGVSLSDSYHLVEGRIMVQNTWQERPVKNIVDCELYASPVFNNIREIAYLTAWKG